MSGRSCNTTISGMEIYIDPCTISRNLITKTVNFNYNRKISKVLIKMSFQPVVDDNNHIVLYIFSSNKENPEFITDSNVELCGSLR